MLKPPFATAAAAILITLAGGPMGLGEAHARAIYTGTFDPRGPVYGFDGTHRFEVDEACLEEDGWKVVNNDISVYDFYTANTTNYTKCGTAALTGGTLTVRKYASPGSDLDAPITGSATFTFPYSQAEPNTLDIWAVYVEGGELKGVDTFVVGSFGAFDTRSWYLQWASGFAPFSFGDNDLDITFGVDPVFLLSSPCAVISDSCFTPPSLVDVPPAIPTFTRQPNPVPEPWTLPLVGAALGALAWTRRRR